MANLRSKYCPMMNPLLDRMQQVIAEFLELSIEEVKLSLFFKNEKKNVEIVEHLNCVPSLFSLKKIQAEVIYLPKVKKITKKVRIFHLDNDSNEFSITLFLDTLNPEELLKINDALTILWIFSLILLKEGENPEKQTFYEKLCEKSKFASQRFFLKKDNPYILRFGRMLTEASPQESYGYVW